MKNDSLLADSKYVGCGILMGGANVIPGVSGGTVALILGIFERVVTAISHCDLTTLMLLRKRQWGEAARRIDLRFLISLFLGVVLGIAVLGYMMNSLLDSDLTRPYTLAAFFGMIIASAIVVARTITCESRGKLLLYIGIGILGAAIAFSMSLVQKPTEVEASPWYAFLCGAICICTMILPGISGAYVLLFMGAYMHLTGIIKNLAHLHVSLDDVITFVAFAAGCAIGLVGFSKFLRWLLARHHSATMAILCGFMIGALRQIWPFQQEIEKHRIDYYMPDAFDMQVIGVIASAVIAMIAVLFLERCGIEPEAKE